MLRVTVESLEVASQEDVVHHRGNCTAGRTRADKGGGFLLNNSRPQGTRVSGFSRGLGDK